MEILRVYLTPGLYLEWTVVLEQNVEKKSFDGNSRLSIGDKGGINVKKLATSLFFTSHRAAGVFYYTITKQSLRLVIRYVLFVMVCCSIQSPSVSSQ